MLIKARAMHGFTIVELLIVMFVAAIMMMILFGPLDALYTSSVTDTKKMTQVYDARASLRMIERDVALAGGFYTTNESDPVGPTGLGSKWNTAPYTYEGSGADNRVLIIGRYATNMGESSDTVDNPARVILMLADCATPIENTMVFYVKDGTLYRRSSPDASPSSRCSSQSALSNGMHQTCAPGASQPECQGSDAVIARGVKKFAVTYYGSDGNEMPYPSDASAATSVEVEIQLSDGSGSNIMTSSSKLRMIRVNGTGV